MSDERTLEQLLAAGEVKSALLFGEKLDPRERELVRQAYEAGLAHGALPASGDAAAATEQEDVALDHNHWALARVRGLMTERDLLLAERARLREALRPFAEFGERTTTKTGWSRNVSHELIPAWFGSDDFRAARAALSAGGEPTT